MKQIALCALLLLGLASPRPACAQDAPEPRTSLSLRPFGSTYIGAWHRASPRLELGVELGAAVSRESGEGDVERDTRTFAVEPSAKLFGAARGDLRPYGIGSVHYQDTRYVYSPDLEERSAAVGASVGLGLEWSPVARVRIGGHAGLAAELLDGSRTDVGVDGPFQQDTDGWRASTFTSGLVFYYTF